MCIALYVEHYSRNKQVKTPEIINKDKQVSGTYPSSSKVSPIIINSEEIRNINYKKNKRNKMDRSEILEVNFIYVVNFNNQQHN